MSFLSKLFGSKSTSVHQVPIPQGATCEEAIGIAIRELATSSNGNCATLIPVGDDSRWIQIMDSVINCHYPHHAPPDEVFPDLIGDPIVDSVDGFEKNLYFTVSVKTMDDARISAWIRRCFAQVLAVDPDRCSFQLKLEHL